MILLRIIVLFQHNIRKEVKMFRKLYVITIIFTIAVFMGCQMAPQLSPMQKRQITTRLIEGGYENSFRATLTVLQDQGYVIKNTDMNSGLIVANIDKETSKLSQFFQAIGTGEIYDKGTVVEVSVMVNKIAETQTEIRVNIQETRYSASGGKQNIKQIWDLDVYKRIFDEVVVEVKRREAIGR